MKEAIKKKKSYFTSWGKNTKVYRLTEFQEQKQVWKVCVARIN